MWLLNQTLPAGLVVLVLLGVVKFGSSNGDGEGSNWGGESCNGGDSKNGYVSYRR